MKYEIIPRTVFSEGGKKTAEEGNRPLFFQSDRRQLFGVRLYRITVEIRIAVPDTIPSAIGIRLRRSRVNSVQIPETKSPVPIVSIPIPASLQYAGLFSSLTLS